MQDVADVPDSAPPFRAGSSSDQGDGFFVDSAETDAEMQQSTGVDEGEVAAQQTEVATQQADAAFVDGPNPIEINDSTNENADGAVDADEVDAVDATADAPEPDIPLPVPATLLALNPCPALPNDPTSAATPATSATPSCLEAYAPNAPKPTGKACPSCAVGEECPACGSSICSKYTCGPGHSCIVEWGKGSCTQYASACSQMVGGVCWWDGSCQVGPWCDFPYPPTCSPVSCVDGNAATADLCSNNGCQHAELACDDGNPCTQDTQDSCMGCVFTPTPPKACSTLLAGAGLCSSGTCKPTGPASATSVLLPANVSAEAAFGLDDGLLLLGRPQNCGWENKHVWIGRVTADGGLAWHGWLPAFSAGFLGSLDKGLSVWLYVSGPQPMAELLVRATVADGALLKWSLPETTFWAGGCGYFTDGPTSCLALLPTGIVCGMYHCVAIPGSTAKVAAGGFGGAGGDHYVWLDNVTLGLKTWGTNWVPGPEGGAEVAMVKPAVTVQTSAGNGVKGWEWFKSAANGEDSWGDNRSATALKATGGSTHVVAGERSKDVWYFGRGPYIARFEAPMKPAWTAEFALEHSKSAPQPRDIVVLPDGRVVAVGLHWIGWTTNKGAVAGQERPKGPGSTFVGAHIVGNHLLLVAYDRVWRVPVSAFPAP
ncbi:MAG: hypothetical protein FJ100_09040 [Deltaproteobacteria bacterium]|nr:hypothetical protein [Deltaproteobacteria bacterium]